jgi:membrane protease YdiL (CAAX protease family)
MSIFHAVATVTTMPAGATTAPVSGDNLIVLLGFAAWAIVGLVVAWVFGVFRSSSIVGPERLGSDDSGWDPLIVFFMAFSLASLGAGYVMRGQLSGDLKMLALSAEGSIGACAAIFVLIASFRPGLLKSLGASPRGIPSGLAGGAINLFVLYPLIVLASILVTSIYLYLKVPPPGPHELLQVLGNTHDRGVMAATVALAVFAAPVAEELMYRGLLQTALVRGFWALIGSEEESNQTGTTSNSAVLPPGANPQALDYYRPAPKFQGSAPAMARWAGVVVAALVFAGIHMNLAFFLPIFVLALGLGYVYERTGNIWVNIVTHGLFNGAQIIYFVAAAH